MRERVACVRASTQMFMYSGLSAESRTTFSTLVGCLTSNTFFLFTPFWAMIDYCGSTSMEVALASGSSPRKK